MSYSIDEAIAVMGRDYLLLAFLVNLGALQIATSISGARAFWILPWRLATRFAGLALVVLGVAVFVLSPMWIDGPWAAGSVADGASEGREWGRAAFSELTNARTLNDIHGGFDGNDYAARFPLAAFLAFLVSALAGGVMMRLKPPEVEPVRGASGLDAASHSNFISASFQSFRVMRRSIKSDFWSLMSETPSWSLPKLIERRWRG